MPSHTEPRPGALPRARRAQVQTRAHARRCVLALACCALLFGCAPWPPAGSPPGAQESQVPAASGATTNLAVQVVPMPAPSAAASAATAPSGPPAAAEEAPTPESVASAAAPPPVQPPAAPAPPTTEQATREVLAFSDELRRMPVADLAREIARLGETPGNPKSVLELALVLGQTHSPGDAARGAALLDPLLKSTSPQTAPWQPLARLVANKLAEQRRLEEQIDRQNQQLRDSQRRIDQLSDKLEALKAIERSLTTRNAPGAPAAGNAPAASGAPASRSAPR